MSFNLPGFFKKQITEKENEAGLIPARIAAVHKENYKIISSMGETNAKLKSSIFYQNSEYMTYPTVGDYVLIQYVDSSNSIIYRVLDRFAFFSRKGAGKSSELITGSAEQAVAANFEYIFLLMSLNLDFNIRKMERFLTSAWQSNATPVIILTKSDLCEDISQKEEEMRLAAIGVDVISISTYTDYGLEHLQPYLKMNHTIVVFGASGVGKSSLINRLSEDSLMKVSDIRESDSRGRHTTTHRQLIPIRNGAFLIDTPGIRELSFWDGEKGVSETFSDIKELASHCRFSNCKHDNEPGCAIQTAIYEGTLTPERYQSYQKLLKEVLFAEKKAIRKTINAKKSSKKMY